MRTGLLAARLRVEFGFYELTGRTQEFVGMWGVKDALCSVRENSLVLSKNVFCFCLFFCWFIFVGFELVLWFRVLRKKRLTCKSKIEE